MSLLTLLVLTLLVTLFPTILYYRKRRDKIEMTCIEESRLKTFADEYVSNLLISLPLVIMIYLIHTIMELFTI